jgi:hypothetical protein
MPSCCRAGWPVQNEASRERSRALAPTVEQGASHCVRFVAQTAGSEWRFSLAYLDSFELCRRLRVIAEHERLVYEVVLVLLDWRGVRHLLLELLVQGGVNLFVAGWLIEAP